MDGYGIYSDVDIEEKGDDGEGNEDHSGKISSENEDDEEKNKNKSKDKKTHKEEYGEFQTDRVYRLKLLKTWFFKYRIIQW